YCNEASRSARFTPHVWNPRKPEAALGPICRGHPVVSDNPDPEFGAPADDDPRLTLSAVRLPLRYVYASTNACVNALCRGDDCIPAVSSKDFRNFGGGLGRSPRLSGPVFRRGQGRRRTSEATI